eukprot:m.13937 g.13937  ORF g.13937 m.13937 type:complete len:695 (-) comp7677_c0_seq1:113-2197(-)
MTSSSKQGCCLRLHISGFDDEKQVDMFMPQLAKFGKVRGVDIPNRVPDLVTEKPTFRGFAYVDMEYENEAKFSRFQNAYNNAKWKSLSLRIRKAKQTYMERLKKEKEQKTVRKKRIQYRQRRYKRSIAPISELTDSELGKREGWETGRYGRAVPTLRIRNPRGRVILVEARKVTPRLTKFKEDNDQQLEKLLAKYEKRRVAEATTPSQATTEIDLDNARKVAKRHLQTATSSSSSQNTVKSLKKTIDSLFDDDDDSDDDSNDDGDRVGVEQDTEELDSKTTQELEDEFAPRASGNKAQALVEAQMKLGTDKRFQLTEDFLDNDSSNSNFKDNLTREEQNDNEEHIDMDEVGREINDERHKQLDIIAKLTGQPPQDAAQPSQQSHPTQTAAAPQKKKKENVDVWGLQSVHRYDPTATNNDDLLVHEEEEKEEPELIDNMGEEKQQSNDSENAMNSQQHDDADANVDDLNLDDMYEHSDTLDGAINGKKSLEDKDEESDGNKHREEDKKPNETKKPFTAIVKINKDIKKELMPASNNWRDTKSISTFSFGFGGGSVVQQPKSNENANETATADNEDPAREGENDLKRAGGKHSGFMNLSTNVSSAAVGPRNVLQSSLTSSTSTSTSQQGRSVQFFFMTTSEYKYLLNDKARCFVRKQTLDEIQQEWEDNREETFAEIREQSRQAKKRQQRARRLRS